MLDEPPLSLIKTVGIILAIVLTLFVGRIFISWLDTAVERANKASYEALKRSLENTRERSSTELPREGRSGGYMQDEPNGWTMSFEEYARMQARGSGLDEDRVIRIMMCESGGNPYAKNSSSSAFGLFQFISGTWQSTKKRAGRLDWEQDNAVHQIEAAIWLIKTDGFSHWVCK